ncbi:hypothetical protein D3C80_588050 [compost metagenome]
MGAFFQRAKVRPFKVQTQRLILVFFQISAHHFDAVLHKFVAAGDQRRQITGTAGFFVGTLHDLQRLFRNGLQRVVKLHAATAVKLHVDQTGGQDSATQIARFNAGRQFSQRANSFNQPISDYHCMVVKYVVAGKNTAVG